MTDEEKTSVQSAVDDLKAVLGNEDAGSSDIRTSMDALIESSQAMATRLYQEAAQAEAASGGSDDMSSDDEDIVEAEIIEDDDEEDDEEPGDDDAE
jgi:molecular chaperone DnaK